MHPSTSAQRAQSPPIGRIRWRLDRQLHLAKAVCRSFVDNNIKRIQTARWLQTAARVADEIQWLLMFLSSFCKSVANASRMALTLIINLSSFVMSEMIQRSKVMSCRSFLRCKMRFT